MSDPNLPDNYFEFQDCNRSFHALINMVNENDYNIPFPVETIAEYGEGGLYPIDIGDKFQDERYEIVNKLGVGGYSTVWAARDHVQASSSSSFPVQNR